MKGGGEQRRVIIVGGGFGGLSAASALSKEPVDIELIDRRNHHLFQPLLYQVASAVLAPADISMPIRGVLRSQKNVRVRLGEVAGVDLAAALLTVEHWSARDSRSREGAATLWVRSEPLTRERCMKRLEV